MAINEEDLVREVSILSVQRLHKWIRLGWVKPERHESVAPEDSAGVEVLAIWHCAKMPCARVPR